MLETVSHAGTHLVGAATYARWAGFWPGAAGPFAEPMNEMPKVVFSESLSEAGSGPARIARGNLANPSPASSKSAPVGTCWRRAVCGSPALWFRPGWYEYRLVVLPVILGAGERLFAAPFAIEPVSRRRR